MGPRGKAVRDRRDPVTVIGDETRRPSPLARRAGKGAGSRTIREPGDLPGTRALRTGLRGRPGLPHAISPSRRPCIYPAVSPRTVLVLGGVRAGKSAFAVARARALGGRVVFVATAEAGDEEMAARIARHRAERPPAWRTVEVPLALTSALTALEGEADVVVVDCLNLWVANMLDKTPERTDSGLLSEAAELEAVARRPRFSLILVERGRLGDPPGDGARPALSRRARPGESGRGTGRR